MSDLCGYSDACIVLNGAITVTGTNDGNRNQKLTFKNNVPFKLCISKINNTFIDNAEDLDIIMLMYNLLEYSDNCDNYSMSLGSLRNYNRDEVNYDANKIIANHRINNSKTTTSRSFEHKTKKKTGTRPADNNTLETEVVVPLK